MRLFGLLAVPVLALLLLAAHLVHAGALPVAGSAILLAGLVAVPRPWAARTLQAVLAVAAIEWILVTVGLAQLRLRHGEPYLRLCLILGAVTVFTAIAAALIEHPVLRARFGLAPRPARDPTRH